MFSAKSIPLVLPTVIFLWLLFPCTVLAQIHPGVKAGINNSNYYDVDDRYNSRYGLTAGAFLEISIPVDRVSLRPELIYSLKGGQRNRVELKVHYLEVPVLAKRTFSRRGRFTPYVMAGPYAALAVKSTGYIGREVLDMESRTNFDAGGVLELGSDLSWMGIKWQIGLRYSLGFVDAFDGPSSKNRNLSLTAGILF